PPPLRTCPTRRSSDLGRPRSGGNRAGDPPLRAAARGGGTGGRAAGRDLPLPPAQQPGVAGGGRPRGLAAGRALRRGRGPAAPAQDRKSTRLNSSHVKI